MFPYYGGRGITICERWLESFQNFLDDMGPCPTDYEIDRINPDGHYEPNNCRWVDGVQQANNKRNNVHGLVDGQRVTAAEAARLTGLKYWTVVRRFHSGCHLHAQESHG